ncbi:hypothetical protein J437_LFUL011853 [Ladona fulva]|uniref:VASP tetramerisation domain-containing protein n=1 Tax=Ladona fulva TaxID=123851 RepID=A0A8K0P8B9_LADFU|nr:hypothetical protein J437_LFUL011853 [Ladona fulva]
MTASIQSIDHPFQQGTVPSPFPSQSTENSGSSTSSSGSSNYGTLGRGGAAAGGGGSGVGMASMMDEMAKTLARRRAAAEKQDSRSEPQQDADNGQEKKPWEKNQPSGGSSNGTKFSNGASDGSPKPSRKRFGSASEESGKTGAGGEISQQSTIPGSPVDLESLKQDLLREMRKELGKIKQEIIDGEACFPLLCVLNF